MVYQPPTAPLAPCSPVWQYILIMCADIQGSINGLVSIGIYNEDKPVLMTELAKYLDTVVDGIRSRAEALTGWTPPKS